MANHHSDEVMGSSKCMTSLTMLHALLQQETAPVHQVGPYPKVCVLRLFLAA